MILTEHTTPALNSAVHKAANEQQTVIALLSAACEGHLDEIQDALNNATWSVSAGRLPAQCLQGAVLSLAVRCQHLDCAKALSTSNLIASRNFLLAAAETGSKEVMAWALQGWFGQFNGVQSFGPSQVDDLHTVMRVACQRGDVVVLDMLLAGCTSVRSYSSPAVALHFACASSNASLAMHLLQSGHLKTALQRSSSSLAKELAEAVAETLFLAAQAGDAALAGAVLATLRPQATLAAVRPLLEPYMQPLFEQVALGGNAALFEELLVQLPEFYPAFGMSSLLAALSAGHTQLASSMRWLLAMRPEDFSAADLLPGSMAVAAAELSGQVAAAIETGDTARVEQLLQAGTLPPQLQMDRLKQAVKRGHGDIVLLLLPSHLAKDAALETCMDVICATAAEAGQLRLLQGLPLQLHLRSHTAAVAGYLVSSTLGGHQELSAWLLTQALHPWRVLNTALRCLLSNNRGTLSRMLSKSCKVKGSGQGASALLLLLLTAAKLRPSRELLLEPEVLLQLVVAAAEEPTLVQLVAEWLQNGCVAVEPRRIRADGLQWSMLEGCTGTKGAKGVGGVDAGIHPAGALMVFVQQEL